MLHFLKTRAGPPGQVDDRARRLHARGGLFFAVAFLIAASSSGQVVPQIPAADLARATSSLRAAVSECDAPETLRRAAELLSIAPAGSDAWIEACAHRVNGLRENWDPLSLEQALQSLDKAVADRRAAEPEVRRSALGPLSLQLAPLVLLARIHGASVLQSRDDHAGALVKLRRVLDDLQSGPCHGSSELQRSALFSAARSLELAGRADEARAALVSLRDEALSGPVGSHAGELASALLQRGAGVTSGYAGKYAGDPEHLLRMAAVRAALPVARARLALRADIDASDLPEVILGVADGTPNTRSTAALTVYDPRTPCFAPVIVFHSELLALGMVDIEQVLVHELSHAWLLVRAGTTYERMPGWLIEGVAEGLAGQTEVSLDNLLSSAMLPQPSNFLEHNFWELFGLKLESRACERIARAGVGIALAPWMEEAGLDGLRRLAREIRAGKNTDDALEAASKLRAAPFLASANARLAQQVEARRQAASPVIRSMLEALNQSPFELLGAVESALDENPPPIARGFALWMHAVALESLEQFDGALLAYETLHSERLVLPGYVEIARMGRAKTLMARGDLEDALRELQALRRDAISLEVPAWCADRIEELDARISGKGK